MKFLKKYSVAWVITIVVVLISCAFGVIFARADMLSVTPGNWVCDGADVLSDETEAAVRTYNAEFDQNSAYVGVATVKNLRGWRADNYAERLFNKWELGSLDFLLLMDIGGGQSYFYYGSDRSGFDYASFLDSYVNPDFYAGNYDAAVLGSMVGMESWLADGAVIDAAGYDDIYDGYADYSYNYNYGYGYRYGYRGMRIGSAVISLVILAVIVFFVLNLIERRRYNRWYGRYGGMGVPPVAFVPLFFWHRPGSRWWNHHYHGPGPRGPRGPMGPGAGPRPGGGAHSGAGPRPGGGAHPGGGFGGSARPGGGFGGSARPGGGFSGGHGGGSFGGGGHGGGSFGGGGHGGGHR